MTNKYLNYWLPSSGQIQYPILVVNCDSFYDTFLVSLAELIIKGGEDAWGYSWGDHAIIVDALGCLYQVNYVNFGHPIGAVYPSALNQMADINNVSALVQAIYYKSKEEQRGKLYRRIAFLSHLCGGYENQEQKLGEIMVFLDNCQGRK